MSNRNIARPHDHRPARLGGTRHSSPAWGTMGTRYYESRRNHAVFLLCLLLLAFSGCAQQMENQRRVESQEAAPQFADGIASRAIAEHTIPASPPALHSVSRIRMQEDRAWLTLADQTDEGGYLSGKADGRLVNVVPPPVLADGSYEQLIRRGRERFEISCAPCHDLTGSGNGMVPRRGFPFPPSYHSDRLRGMPLGYFFNVITDGRGQMPGYGDFLSTNDRWAIAAYVRTLQFSQYADMSGRSTQP